MFEIKLVVLDFDGTLYHQLPVQFFNAIRAAFRLVVKPRILKEIRIIIEYRKLREQYSKIGIPIKEVEKKISENFRMSSYEMNFIRDKWLIHNQSKLIYAFRRKWLLSLISQLRKKGIIVVVWSDYPLEEKIKDLHLEYDLLISSEDPDIQFSKPNPTGLRVIIERYNLTSQGVLMVGDRDDLDGDSAYRAGVKYVSIGKESRETLLSLVNLK